MKYKIGIIGSRNYKNLEKVKLLVSFFPKETYIIVSGHGRGVDIAAEEKAIELGIETIIFKPDVKPNCSNREFAIAAYARNTLIAKEADYLFAFWDGKSEGTLDTIKKYVKLGKEMTIIGEENG